MDEQSDRRFQIKKGIARQRALQESIRQELEIYREAVESDKLEAVQEKVDIRKQIVDSRVNIEDARQRIAYNIKRLRNEFEFEVDPKELILNNPIKALAVSCAIGLYFGLGRKK